jgi:hypothetical protein
MEENTFTVIFLKKKDGKTKKKPRPTGKESSTVPIRLQL